MLDYLGGNNMTWAEEKVTKKKSTTPTKELMRGSRDNTKYPKVIPTGMKGFDKLIIEPKSDPPKGGLPLGRGKITILAGNPGSGKTIFLANLAAKLLKDGKSFMYVTFERDGNEFVGIVDIVYNNIYDEECPVENIYFLDYFCSYFGDAQIKVVADKAREFYTKTKSPFIAIDSITEMAKMETTLRFVMKNLQKELFNTGLELAVIGVSQFRGTWDKGVAGGKGMSHKADVVVNIETAKVDRWNREFYPWLEIGDLYRSISVMKTAGYSHSLHQYPMIIEESGQVIISDDPLSILANKTKVD